MATTHTITLPCGHKLAITIGFLAYDVVTCRPCRKIHKLSKKERKQIARDAGWDEKHFGKFRNE